MIFDLFRKNIGEPLICEFNKRPNLFHAILQEAYKSNHNGESQLWTTSLFQYLGKHNTLELDNNNEKEAFMNLLLLNSHNAEILPVCEKYCTPIDLQKIIHKVLMYSTSTFRLLLEAYGSLIKPRQADDLELILQTLRDGNNSDLIIKCEHKWKITVNQVKVLTYSSKEKDITLYEKSITYVATGEMTDGRIYFIEKTKSGLDLWIRGNEIIKSHHVYHVISTPFSALNSFRYYEHNNDVCGNDAKSIHYLIVDEFDKERFAIIIKHCGNDNLQFSHIMKGKISNVQLLGNMIILCVDEKRLYLLNDGECNALSDTSFVSVVEDDMSDIILM